MNFKSQYYRLWGAAASKWTDKETGSWRAERPIINKDKCCRCGWCYLYCANASVVEEEDGFGVNLDFCKGCGVCAAECPVGAIEMVPERGRKK